MTGEKSGGGIDFVGIRAVPLHLFSNSQRSRNSAAQSIVHGSGHAGIDAL